MYTASFSRRAFLSRGSAAAVAAAGVPLLWSESLQAEIPMPAAHNALETALDGFIAPYMKAMNAPGLTVGLTDKSATVRAASYGHSNLDTRAPVTPDLLFQIGSITKSFVAVVLLQLHDEGKLDLHKPVLDYLPDLPIACPFGTITVHHLLTHTSGLPDNLALFSGDANARLIQGFAPGEHFHYCNAAFDILGLLASHLDGRTWKECVTARILTPLGMKATTGVITTANRDRSAVGYEPYWDDQVYARQGRLAPAPNLIMDDTAGCIASTPGDMATYLRMYLNEGVGLNGRILSAESFKLMSTPYIKAEEFSPTASYGYGIAVDTLDGHKILRHTGGMVSFASSMHIDLDGGVAAFASINAMQGYRPTAVTEYAVQLMRAQSESKPLPATPAIVNPLEVKNATDYAGTFTSPAGRALTFKADGEGLILVVEGKSIPLQRTGSDSFVSTIPGEFTEAGFSFGRKEEPKSGSEDDSKPKPPVVEVSYRDEWYVNAAYTGPRTFAVPHEWSQFVGCYYSDSPWAGGIHIYALKGKLLADGLPLTPVGGALFRAGEETWSPETMEFLQVVAGKARILRFAGADFTRMEVD
ncbi:MAG TPA: serine hydrolase domain-containing protein [Terracidiphilus sp.]|nr:serine hydrolase domain-containing protein [Terracidiphilus sp.]